VNMSDPVPAEQARSESESRDHTVSGSSQML
jgi:hypothetical protein